MAAASAGPDQAQARRPCATRDNRDVEGGSRLEPQREPIEQGVDDIREAMVAKIEAVDSLMAYDQRVVRNGAVTASPGDRSHSSPRSTVLRIGRNEELA